jgi:hypothetical protein
MLGAIVRATAAWLAGKSTPTRVHALMNSRRATHPHAHAHVHPLVRLLTESLAT